MFGKAMLVCTPAALGGLYFTGHLGAASGQAYDVPVETAYERIAYMPLPPDLQKSGLMMTADREPGRSVKWRFLSRGSEVMNVTATLSPLADGKATQLETDVVVREDNPAVGKGKVTTYESFARSYLAEQIASRIEGRPYDRKRAGQLAGAYVMANTDKIFSEVDSSLDEHVAAEKRAKQETAYHDAQRNFGKPTLDLGKDGR